jgi:hypothetical protein
VERIVLVRSKHLGRPEEDAHTSPRPPSRQVRETVSGTREWIRCGGLTTPTRVSTGQSPNDDHRTDSQTAEIAPSISRLLLTCHAHGVDPCLREVRRCRLSWRTLGSPSRPPVCGGRRPPGRGERWRVWAGPAGMAQAITANDPPPA